MENTYHNFDIFYILQSWIYVSSKLIKFIIGCRRDAVTRKSRGLSTGATLRLSRLLKLTGFTWRRYEHGWIGVVMFTGINRKVYSSHPGETNAGTLKSDRAIFHGFVSRRGALAIDSRYTARSDAPSTTVPRDGRSPGYYMPARTFATLKKRLIIVWRT